MQHRQVIEQPENTNTWIKRLVHLLCVGVLTSNGCACTILSTENKESNMNPLFIVIGAALGGLVAFTSDKKEEKPEAIEPEPEAQPSEKAIQGIVEKCEEYQGRVLTQDKEIRAQTSLLQNQEQEIARLNQELEAARKEPEPQQIEPDEQEQEEEKENDRSVD